MRKLLNEVFLSLLFIKSAMAACDHISNCTTCTGSNCTMCQSSHVLYDGSCYECPGTCETCDEIRCTFCKPGRWGNFCAEFCTSKTCSKCRINDGHCLQCNSGLYGSKCEQNCTLCQNSTCDSFQCKDGCIPGYYQYKSGDTTSCKQCSLNCLSCRNDRNCTICNDGYYLRQFFAVSSREMLERCSKCPSTISSCHTYCEMPNCDKCQIQDENFTCTECTRGYRYNGDRCIVRENNCSDGCASHCDENSLCLSNCYTGWSGERCLNTCGSQCIRCSKSNNSICQECNSDYFTSSCNVECPSNCTKLTDRSSCSIDNGHCVSDCNHRFWGPFCNISCSDGCASSNYLSQMCKRNDGACENGCRSGFTGVKCDTSTTTAFSTIFVINTTIISQTNSTSPSQTTVGNRADASAQNDSQNIIIIGSGAGGGVLLLLLSSIFIVCLLKRRKSANNDTDQVEWTENETYNNSENEYTRSASPELANEMQDYVYAIPDKPRKSKINSKNESEESYRTYDNIELDLEQVSLEETNVDNTDLEELEEGTTGFTTTNLETPTTDIYYNTACLVRNRIQVSELFEFIKKKTDYEEEFEKLPSGITRPCKEALKPMNLAKNRFNGIYAYDATRVVLQSENFVNANYIDGYKKFPAYIASLGPTKSTMDNFVTFWEMIWQENVDKIIMLTNLEEGEKMKCEQYWPDQGTQNVYSDYKVTCAVENIFSDFSVRELVVAKEPESRKVKQFHYTAWPDKTVPDNVASLLEFRNEVEQTQSESTGPMMVHCSAGIGRTGTYIALDILINEGKQEESVDIFGCVNALRGQRVHMVQNLEQYVYLHHCILYALTCDSKPLPVSDIPQLMINERISNQHQAFVNMQLLIDGDRTMKTKDRDIKENRKGADVPGDEHRVRLTLTKHDYINAVFLNGYQKVDKFIIAQTPLPTTVEDFVSMLYQERCPVVVCLDEENIMDKSVGQYLPPANKVSTFGHFQVMCMKSEQRPDFVIRELIISKCGAPTSEEMAILHYQFNGWSSSDPVPLRIRSFLNMIFDVEEATQHLTSEQPIAVHCSTGSERSGLFCAVSILLEKVAIENELSVLDTICQVWSRRRSAFRDIEQYRFCYSCVEEMLEKSDTNTYCNIMNASITE